MNTGEEGPGGAGKGGVVPPVETRWKPGQSGNPNGRPKGAATSFERVLEQELERHVPGDPNPGDHEGSRVAEGSCALSLATLEREGSVGHPDNGVVVRECVADWRSASGSSSPEVPGWGRDFLGD